MKRKFEYIETPAGTVVDYFSKDFQPRNEKEKIIFTEWFYDSTRGMFIFKLAIETEESGI